VKPVAWGGREKERGKMLRRSHILTTAALLAVCATPASAVTFEDRGSDGAVTSGDVAPPPSSIAVSAGDEYQDLRSPDAKDAARNAGSTSEPSQDLRSPDAVDAAQHRGLYEPDKAPYTLTRDYGSPDAADAARDLPPVQVPAVSTVEVQAPSGGFDWGDAGIGAAGMFGLFGITAGLALLLTGRRRRQGIEVAH
jgi:hypothetical protein